ncbi:MAG: 3-oxoacid CoA-transferase subunit B [Alphaproteobacteria bacterium]|nr:3-oxoacid CoA-transferase subunit B [Alphaproteobacteria bacterium]
MSPQPLNRLQIAWRAANDITDGMLVNLGLGMPVAVADYVRPEMDVFIQSENGVIGVGPAAPPDQVDSDLVDAGSRRVTLRPGGSFVDSSWSFAMIRGGHIDVAILGAFEVASNGDLANWDMRLPNKGPLIGGAMDLAACARSVWVLMEHVTRQGAPRLLNRCTLPLTALHCVTRVYTDLAVIDVTADGMLVREMIDGLSAQDLRDRTEAPLNFAPDCRTLTAPAIALPDEPR